MKRFVRKMIKAKVVFYSTTIEGEITKMISKNVIKK